jgi:hypothetical protein
MMYQSATHPGTNRQESAVSELDRIDDARMGTCTYSPL